MSTILSVCGLFHRGYSPCQRKFYFTAYQHSDKIKVSLHFVFLEINKKFHLNWSKLKFNFSYFLRGALLINNAHKALANCDELKVLNLRAGVLSFSSYSIIYMCIRDVHNFV